MLLKDLTLWLELDGIGTRATNLFYGPMPTSPDLLVDLNEYGGLDNEPHMGGSTVNLEFPSVQALVRGARGDYDTPRLLIQQVVTSFAKIGDTVIGVTKYGCVMAKQPPFYLMTDQNFRHVFAVNFHVQKGYSTS